MPSRRTVSDPTLELLQFFCMRQERGSARLVTSNGTILILDDAKFLSAKAKSERNVRRIYHLTFSSLSPISVETRVPLVSPTQRPETHGSAPRKRQASSRSRSTVAGTASRRRSTAKALASKRLPK